MYNNKLQPFPPHRK